MASRSSKSYPAKIAANGQVVIPKDLRDALLLKGGDTIFFELDTGKSGLLRINIKKASVHFESLIGSLKHLAHKPYDEILRRLDEEEAG